MACPGLMDEIREGGGKSKTKGALEGVKESVSDLFQGDEDEDREPEAEERERPRRTRGSSSHRERER